MRSHSTLVYGFGSFGLYQQNPSGLAVESLTQKQDFSSPVICSVLPVDFDAAKNKLHRLLEVHQPDRVLGFGVYNGTEPFFKIESTAVNQRQEKLNGAVRVLSLDVGGLAATRLADLNLPWFEGALDLQALRPARFFDSKDAGRFLCNASLWWATRWAQQYGAKSGFVHVPMSRNGNNPNLVRGISHYLKNNAELAQSWGIDLSDHPGDSVLWDRMNEARKTLSQDQITDVVHRLVQCVTG